MKIKITKEKLLPVDVTDINYNIPITLNADREYGTLVRIRLGEQDLQVEIKPDYEDTGEIVLVTLQDVPIRNKLELRIAELEQRLNLAETQF